MSLYSHLCLSCQTSLARRRGFRKVLIIPPTFGLSMACLATHEALTSEFQSNHLRCFLDVFLCHLHFNCARGEPLLHTEIILITQLDTRSTPNDHTFFLQFAAVRKCSQQNSCPCVIVMFPLGCCLVLFVLCFKAIDSFTRIFTSTEREIEKGLELMRAQQAASLH